MLKMEEVGKDNFLQRMENYEHFLPIFFISLGFLLKYLMNYFDLEKNVTLKDIIYQHNYFQLGTNNQQ